MPVTDIEDIWLFWSSMFVSQARTISDFNESLAWPCYVLLELYCESVIEAALFPAERIYWLSYLLLFNTFSCLLVKKSPLSDKKSRSTWMHAKSGNAVPLALQPREIENRLGEGGLLGFCSNNKYLSLLRPLSFLWTLTCFEYVLVYNFNCLLRSCHTLVYVPLKCVRF